MSRKSINDSINELKHLTEITCSKLNKFEQKIHEEKLAKVEPKVTPSDEILDNEFFVQFAKEFANKFSEKFVEYFTTQLVNNRSI